MSVRRIIETFETWRAEGRPVTLATVYETLGSTYSKAGHRILIAGNGDYQGLVSGGCLEGDIAERARRVLEARVPATVTYDLRDDADELWGLGVGCNGLIRVFLQPLDPEAGHAPFAAMATALLSRQGGAAATVIEAGPGRVAAGATLVRGGGADAAFGLDAPEPDAPEPDAPELDAGNGHRALVERLEAGCARVRAAGRAELVSEAGLRVLYAPLKPVPRLLVLGGGLDAVPIVDMAAALGWFVTVADHRPGYLARGGFERADGVVPVQPGRLRASLEPEDFDAVLVMSHHLATDEAYLRELAEQRYRYLGVLGPPARRARLLDALGSTGESLRARLKGPVGLDIGADSPESIALSILAELQAVLSGSRG